MGRRDQSTGARSAGSLTVQLQGGSAEVLLYLCRPVVMDTETLTTVTTALSNALFLLASQLERMSVLPLAQAAQVVSVTEPRVIQDPGTAACSSGSSLVSL